MQKKSYGRVARLSVESLEGRRMLAAVAVANDTDVVDGTIDNGISALISNPGADGTISLREAIEAANSGQNDFDPGSGTFIPDTITFDPTVFDPTDGMMDTIVLTEGQLTITDALTINGPGWDELTIDASHPVVFTQAA